MIHKQVVRDGSIIYLPIGSNVLKVAIQHMDFTIWYDFVDEGQDNIGCEIKVVGTGWKDSSVGWTYIDTVFEGIFVWHVFIREAK